MAKVSEGEILNLLERGKFKQVISKLKRGGLSIKQERAKELLLKSHLNYAEDLMQKGDFLRAVREFDSAYNLKSDTNILIKKSLAKLYMHHFKDVEKILINLLNNKDALYLYLLSKVYQKEEIDEKLLKKLNTSRINYILFLKHLFDNNIKEAKKLLDNIKPRLKVEKDNILAIKSIVEQSDFYGNKESLKTLYKLLLGFEYIAYHTNSFKKIEKELSKNKDPLLKLNPLLEKRNFVKSELIDRTKLDDEIKNKLHFNNMILMIERRSEQKAYSIFKMKYKIFATYAEAILPLITILRKIPIPYHIIKDFYEIYIENFKNILKNEIIVSSSFVFSYILQMNKDHFNDLKELFLQNEFYSFEPFLLIDNIEYDNFRFIDNVKDYKFSIVSFVSYVLDEKVKIECKRSKRIEIVAKLFELISMDYSKIKDTYEYLMERTCNYVIEHFNVVNDKSVYDLTFKVVEVVLKHKEELDLDYYTKAFLYSYKTKKQIEKVSNNFLKSFNFIEMARKLGLEPGKFPDEIEKDLLDFNEAEFDLNIIYDKTKKTKDVNEILYYLQIIKKKLYFKDYYFLKNFSDFYIDIYENIGSDGKINGMFFTFINTLFTEHDDRNMLLGGLENIFFMGNKEAACSLLRLFLNCDNRDFSKAWYLKIVGIYILNCGDTQDKLAEMFKNNARKFKSLKKLYDKVTK